MSTKTNEGTSTIPQFGQAGFPIMTLQPLSDGVQQVMDFAGTGSMLYIGTGRVGIGTETPGTTLVVQGADTMVQLNSSSAEASMSFYNATDAETWHMGAGGGGVAAGQKAFFLWNDTNGYSLIVTPTSFQILGAVQLPSAVTISQLPASSTAPSTATLQPVMVDTTTGTLYYQASSITDAPPAVPLASNPQIDQAAGAAFYSWVTKDQSALGVLSNAVAAGLEATVNGESSSDVEEAITTAIGTGLSQTDQTECLAVAQAVVAVLPDTTAAFTAIATSPVAMVLVVNDTNYQLSVISNGGYVDQGMVAFYPGDANLAPVTGVAGSQTLTCGLFVLRGASMSNPAAAGAISLALSDTATGNVLGTLYFGYSMPDSSSPICALGLFAPGQQPAIESWFTSFSQSSSQATASATLAAQTIGADSYPAFTVTCNAGHGVALNNYVFGVNLTQNFAGGGAAETGG